MYIISCEDFSPLRFAKLFPFCICFFIFLQTHAISVQRKRKRGYCAVFQRMRIKILCAATAVLLSVVSYNLVMIWCIDGMSKSAWILLLIIFQLFYFIGNAVGSIGDKSQIYKQCLALCLARNCKNGNWFFSHCYSSKCYNNQILVFKVFNNLSIGEKIFILHKYYKI